MNMPARHFQTRCRPVEMRPWRCSGRWRYMHPTVESERGRPQLWSALTGCIYLPPVQTSTRVCAASPSWQLAVSHWAFKHKLKMILFELNTLCLGKKDATVFLTHAVNCGRFCFWRRQSVFLVCVWNISGTAERICAKFTRKTCLIPRSDEFEGQGKRSKVNVTRDKNGTFRPFRRPACGLCLVKHL